MYNQIDRWQNSPSAICISSEPRAINMTEAIQDDRPRVKLPRDLFEALEASAKRRNLSNVGLVRVLLESSDREERLTAQLEAQRLALEEVRADFKGHANRVQDAQSASDERLEAVVKALKLIHSKITEQSSARPSLSGENAAKSKEKARQLELTVWRFTASLVFFVVGLSLGAFVR
jgi:chromosome segregation ATPase